MVAALFELHVSQSMPGPLTCFDGHLTFQNRGVQRGPPLTSSHCHIQHRPISPLKNSTQNAPYLTILSSKIKNVLGMGCAPYPLGRTPPHKPHPSRRLDPRAFVARHLHFFFYNSITGSQDSLLTAHVMQTLHTL